MISQTTVAWVFFGCVGAAVFLLLMYYGGRAWSRGFYQGRREFLHELTINPPNVKGKHSGQRT